MERPKVMDQNGRFKIVEWIEDGQTEKGQRDIFIDGGIGRQIYRWWNRWIDSQMEEQMDRFIDEGIDRYTYTVYLCITHQV